MCSACSGDYEDPDMTNADNDELEECQHTDLVQWNASLGKFVCPICSCDEQLVCTHHDANGTPTTSINLATMYLECAICGDVLLDMNPCVSPQFRESRKGEDHAC